MKNRKFGVEIEVILPYNLADSQYGAHCRASRVIAETLENSRQNGCEVIDNKGRTWKVVHDGSLKRGHATEIVTPPLDYSDIESLQDVIRALRAAGFKANSSCGIHCHVDAAGLEPRQLVNLAKLMNSKQDLLFKGLKVLDGRAKYCKKIEPERMMKMERARSMDKLGAAWFNRSDWLERANCHYNDARYHALNLSSLWIHGTVEFRLFNGTLHAGKIKTYIQLSLALVEKARKARAAVSTPLASNNPKYNLRVFLNGLGLKGPEFKTCRHHLLKDLNGNSAWRTQEQARRAA